MSRASAAKTIKATTGVAVLVVIWQAVRFTMGDIANPAAPIFDFLNNTMRESVGLSSEVSADMLTRGPFAGLLGGLEAVMSWMVGVSVWVFAAVFVGSIGKRAARVVLVGGKQYRAEQREAHEAYRIAAERQAIKDRRRKLRRKALEAREPRRASSGVFPFLLGALFGSFFL